MLALWAATAMTDERLEPPPGRQPVLLPDPAFWPGREIPGCEVWPGQLGRTALYADPHAVAAALGRWTAADRAHQLRIAAWLRAVAADLEPPPDQRENADADR